MEDIFKDVLKEFEEEILSSKKRKEKKEQKEHEKTKTEKHKKIKELSEQINNQIQELRKLLSHF